MQTSLDPAASTILLDVRPTPSIDVRSKLSNEVSYQGQDQTFVLSYGRCSQCSCPGFIGSGYSCARSGCGHHYDEHG